MKDRTFDTGRVGDFNDGHDRKRHGLVMQNIGCAPKELVDLGNASEKDGNVFTHNAVGHQRTSRRDY